MGDESIAGHCATIGNMTCSELEVIAEESGEIISITIFILALLALLGSRCRSVAVRLANDSGFGPLAIAAPCAWQFASREDPKKLGRNLRGDGAPDLRLSDVGPLAAMLRI